MSKTAIRKGTFETNEGAANEQLYQTWVRFD
jgi:hypothetical protein